MSNCVRLNWPILRVNWARKIKEMGLSRGKEVLILLAVSHFLIFLTVMAISSCRKVSLKGFSSLKASSRNL